MFPYKVNSALSWIDRLAFVVMILILVLSLPLTYTILTTGNNTLYNVSLSAWCFAFAVSVNIFLTRKTLFYCMGILQLLAMGLAPAVPLASAIGAVTMILIMNYQLVQKSGHSVFVRTKID